MRLCALFLIVATPSPMVPLVVCLCCKVFYDSACAAHGFVRGRRCQTMWHRFELNHPMHICCIRVGKGMFLGAPQEQSQPPVLFGVLLVSLAKCIRFYNSFMTMNSHIVVFVLMEKYGTHGKGADHIARVFPFYTPQVCRRSLW